MTMSRNVLVVGVPWELRLPKTHMTAATKLISKVGLRWVLGAFPTSFVFSFPVVHLILYVSILALIRNHAHNQMCSL